ncbi:hypothetical protein [Mycobacterium paraense]|uniref:hypothetical protein n=1 Tax=Mycobacterium paraense TaxID=767916 RepID=UPI00187F480B|nr:hypothetical protein [Mycobacterium paraense]
MNSIESQDLKFGQTERNRVNALSLCTAICDESSLGQGLGWRDPDIGCTLVVSRPSADPDLWSEYAAGAQRSYRKHGVECALDVEALRSGADTTLFFAIVDDDGRVVAGVRAKGPLRSADDSHAVLEWAGQPGQQAVRNMITDRIPFGILEMKSAWAADDSGQSRSLTRALARCGFHMMVLLDLQFCMATAATSILNRWRSSGGVVAAIPATTYPDERYRTKMIWWNRRDFFYHADPDQVAKTITETKQLIHELYRRGRVDAAVPNWVTTNHAQLIHQNHFEVA